MTKILDLMEPGVVTGDDVQKLLQVAKDEGYALPAVNVVGSHSVNAVLEAAMLAKSPVMIQLSSGGAGFYAGQGLPGSRRHGARRGRRRAACACAWPRPTAYR